MATIALFWLNQQTGYRKFIESHSSEEIEKQSSTSCFVEQRFAAIKSRCPFGCIPLVECYESTDQPSQPKMPESCPQLEDDNTPIDASWLKENCHSENREDLFCWDCDALWFEVQWYGEDLFEFFVAGTKFDGERIKTRGDIRRMCWLLGSTFFPSAWGQDGP